jgi:outer membrane beta-barrel protein
MKQARTGFLVGLALLLVPGLSAAQGKARAGGETKQPEGEGIEEFDADTPLEGEAGEGAEQPGPAAEGDLGDICKIDPTACPEISMDQAAKRDLKSQIYAVQQIYALRRERFELQPYWAITMNDQFVSHPAPGIALNYYITNVMAVGANFNWYQGLNSVSEFNAATRRAVRVGVPLNEYQWSAALNFSYVPMYGKLAGFGDFIFHWDGYVVGGVGAISTRPIVVFDPRYRDFSFKPKVAFNAGIGLRIFFNRWFAAILELRDYVYNEKLENIDNYDAMFPGNSPQIEEEKARWRQNEENWFGESKLTNNVQAQVGVSIFLPFSWEYRLPK